MEIKEFIENLTEVFEETEASILTPDCYFKELEEYGSLTSLSIITMADECYDVALKSQDIRQADTIQDLFEIIKSKL